MSRRASNVAELLVAAAIIAVAGCDTESYIDHAPGKLEQGYLQNAAEIIVKNYLGTDAIISRQQSSVIVDRSRGNAVVIVKGYVWTLNSRKSCKYAAYFTNEKGKWSLSALKIDGLYHPRHIW
jgi:hypothetical protein